jgi:hypothetical protein
MTERSDAPDRSDAADRNAADRNAADRSDVTDRETLETSENEARLTGGRRPNDQEAFLHESDLDEGHRITDTEIYEGELEARGGAVNEEGDEPLESLTERELREGETDNPDVAAEEGLTYVPPSDPPIVPSDEPEDAEIAAGFGSSALDEPYDVDHMSSLEQADDTMAQLVREAIRADGATSRYADEVAIGTRGGVVALRGVVDDVEDTDNLVEVASRVNGVVEVIDELEVRALER